MNARIAGAKSAMGAAEQIISMMPPHRIYFEGFGGTGTVLLRKRPAEINMVIEKDASAAAQLRTSVQASIAMSAAIVRVIEGDVFDYAAGVIAMPDVLAYFDPPYVMATRRSQRALYRHEFDDADHKRLCAIATAPSVQARIMVSGYAGSLYEVLFKDWRRQDFSVMTRGGRALESVWCNFEPPISLHDARFVGKNFTDRQRIQRKAKRWVSRVLAMPPGERTAVISEIQLALSRLEPSQKRLGDPEL